MRISMTRLILYVRDVARLKAFYETHFGFCVIEEIDSEWAVLMAGEVELALHLAGQPFREVSPARYLRFCATACDVDNRSFLS